MVATQAYLGNSKVSEVSLFQGYLLRGVPLYSSQVILKLQSFLEKAQLNSCHL